MITKLFLFPQGKREVANGFLLRNLDLRTMPFPIAIYDKTVDQVIGTITFRIDGSLQQVVLDVRGRCSLALSVISPYKKRNSAFGDTKRNWPKMVDQETIYNYLSEQCLHVCLIEDGFSAQV